MAVKDSKFNVCGSRYISVGQPWAPSPCTAHPSASHPPHKGQCFMFRLSISRLQSTYTCMYWASPHRCSPTKQRAFWGPAVFAVLGVATGAYSVLGAWPGLGSEGWHGWRCEYLRGHTQRRHAAGTCPSSQGHKGHRHGPVSSSHLLCVPLP